MKNREWLAVYKTGVIASILGAASALYGLFHALIIAVVFHFMLGRILR